MIGEIVSHYRIVERLGSGGMGVVYRAVDELLGREVALKFLPAEMATDREALARFDREARLTSSLNHPNICTVHDVDQHEGQPFIVMELCAGRTVRALIEEGPLPPHRVIDIGIQAAEALGAAHGRGIVHRDIKPANLFLTDDGLVKILDFGLAKLVSSRLSDVSGPGASGPTPVPGDEVTGPGIALGTIAYMSPEQALGQPLDPRSDLFSLGAVLYEMATGERAFQGTSAALVFDRILNHPPMSARRVNPDVPVALDAILGRLLAANRDLRPQDASELSHDLHQAQQAVAASGAGLADRVVAVGRSLGASRRGRRRLVIGLVAMAAVGGGLIAAKFLPRPARALTTRDPILLTGFQNHTGEPVFDGTLSQALAVQLSQSPYLNIVPEERVRETLRLMGREPGEQPSGDVAREVCQRLGVKAMVGGTVSRLGALYVLLVDATACESAVSIAREQGTAERQEQVLDTLGGIASALRGRLGESLKSIREFDVPVARATTPSLDALKAYTLGLAQRARGAELESIPFLERALELDPTFAAAAASLSTVYGNLGESARSESYARLAFDNRKRVSERERLFIEYQFHDRVTGDQLQVADTLEVWKRTFPNDFRPASLLAILYNRQGRFDRAVEEGQDALRRSPGHPFPFSNLAYAYRGAGQYEEARATAERAVALGVETVPTRRLLFQLAVLRGDLAGAQRHVEWAKGNAREFDLVSAQAQVSAHAGRVREATELYRTSIDAAERLDLHEAAHASLAHQALMYALYGDRVRALRAARAALASRPGDDPGSAARVPPLRAAVTLGMLGDPEAESITKAAAERYPHSTPVQSVFLPTVRAAIDLSHERADRAIEHLRSPAPYETGTVAVLLPVYLRGLAYLAQRSGAEALDQFDKILAHRGSDPFSPVCALAHLGRARALGLLGQLEGRARAYEGFFELWKDADADVPILVEARREAARPRPTTDR